MKIKHLNRRKLEQSLSLVWKVFCEYEAKDYPESGRQAFWSAIHSEEYLDMLDAYGAFEDEELLGIIAMRNEGRHVALFFVDGNFHKRGIGRSLWYTILGNNTADTITVNSSLYAVPVYERLGFVPTGAAQEEAGIRYVPMEYRMMINQTCPCKRASCPRHGHCNECRAKHSNLKRPCACE